MTQKINFSRRAALALIAGTSASVALPGFAQAIDEIPVAEMSYGDENAPITMIEYASFTCPHCAAFHTDVYPLIKENYIDTGKVRMVIRAVYFDRLGLWADLMARCGGNDRYFGIANMIYENQSTWTQGESAIDIVNNLYAMGRQAGMNDAEMEACMQDNENAQALVAASTRDIDADGIEGTPTFVINGTVIKNMPYTGFVEAFDKILNEG